MNKLPTVIQVLPALNSGGVERGAIDIALAVKKIGWTSIVISEGGLMRKELERSEVEHIELPLSSKNPFIMHKNFNSLSSIIYDRKVDIVHARSRAPAWSAYYASRRFNTNFVTTFHGTYNYKNFLKKKYNSIMTKGKKVIAISNFIKKHIIDKYGVEIEKIATIPRGIDLNSFNPSKVSHERVIQLSNSWRLSDGTQVIMLPGRLARWKGHKVLIEALGKLKRKDFRCIFVGSELGNENNKNYLLKIIRENNLAEIVQFVNQCNDMPAAYMLSDIVISASTDPEAFGRVSVEAQAMNRIIIASDHGGSSETIINGKTGILFLNNNSESLAKAIDSALQLDIESRKKIGDTSRKHVSSKYRLEYMQQSTVKLYQDLVLAD
ncbi:MAG: Spore coat protein SA [Alphaproteobacteria bacterium MarineAlpha2_Bin1]|nr:MAG: Spore coat protein SA [Alphaproteobacteria bacterium MarineAlpha2_Bin1]